MRIRTAAAAGLLLFAASFALLWAADEAVDASAIAGGTGIVIAGALLGLTFLARRWQLERGAFVSTIVDSHAFYEELASYDTAHAQATRAAAPSGLDDAAAV